MMVNGHFVLPPSLAELFNAHADDVLKKLRVCAVGQVTAYDATKRTASITLGEPTVTNAGLVVPDLNPLLDVPVFTLQGGGVHVGLPITPGNECLVVFNDFNLGEWLVAGGQPAPEDTLRHGLSGAIAFVGLNSGGNPLQTFLAALEGGLAGATSKIAVNQATGLITISNQAGQNLLTILQTFLTAVAASSVLDAPTKAAATAASVALGSLLY